MNLASLLGGARPLGHLVWWTRQRSGALPVAFEQLRRHAALQTRHLDLSHERLPDHLASWAARVDASLCARIVA
jgi:hypothetical protein